MSFNAGGKDSFDTRSSGFVLSSENIESIKLKRFRNLKLTLIFQNPLLLRSTVEFCTENS